MKRTQDKSNRVLLNLYINAADAMPGGGNLFITTSNLSYEQVKGKLTNPKHKNYVMITIADSGSGMDKETLERVFDPFFTTKEMGRGTGLGLAVVYGIVKGTRWKYKSGIRSRDRYGPLRSIFPHQTW